MKVHSVLSHNYLKKSQLSTNSQLKNPLWKPHYNNSNILKKKGSGKPKDAMPGDGCAEAGDHPPKIEG
jgi:hypothetical protein